MPKPEVNNKPGSSVFFSTKKPLEEVFKEMMDNVLEVTEVAVGDEKRFKITRSKLLRFMNDCKREVEERVNGTVVQSQQRRGTLREASQREKQNASGSSGRS